MNIRSSSTIEDAGRLLATIDRYESAIAKLRGRIELYRGNHAVHGTDVTRARLDTAEVILDDFMKAGA